tara:strand:+ start:268 stop:951 length:684 start_codon:yes stop_codon:yes gene_type:complete
MKKIIGLFAICLISFAAFAGNNDLYISQTGTGLTLTVDQIGATNRVGTAANARVTLSGTSMVVDIDQIGDSNTFIASILQGNSSSWDWIVTGDSNIGTLSVGASGDVASSDFDFAATGGSNAFTWTQGAAATATGANNDWVIQGTSNTYTGTCEVVGCINNWGVTGNSNTITTKQTGSADHDITVALTGSSNTVTIDQTDTASTNVANIISTTTGGTIDVDQCASGC